MRLCIADSQAATGAVFYAPDTVTCSSLGLADFYGATVGFPPLTIAEIDALYGAVMLLWVTCYMLRFIRKLIPKGIG